MKVTTDYTKQANPDTMYGGAISSYRMLYWLKDILCNFMSDPINIKDERICKILNMQDGATPEQLNALFDVGVAYSESTKKACTTPMIFISLAPHQFPVRGINQIGASQTAIGGFKPMSMGCKHKIINMIITIMTEKYDSTVVFTDLFEDFLLINEDLFKLDNRMISEFHVTGVSAPEEQKIGQSAHAKVIYASKISVTAIGGISWTTDTQGPIFRGVEAQVKQH
jgi:hypothetical protein